MRLLETADRLRAAGLTVVEEDGWRTRGFDFPAMPKVVVGHHTASNPASGSMPSLGILINGRPAPPPPLPGPLCQVGLSRTGVAHVIAAGKANHAGPGAWKTVDSSEETIGIEAENNGLGEPWPAVQLEAYDLVSAVLLDYLEQPASMFCGHREWALPSGRKIDPTGIDLDQQRGRIDRLLTEGFDMGLSDDDKQWITNTVRDEAQKAAEKAVAAMPPALMVHKLKSGEAVGTVLRAVDLRTERLIRMVGAVGTGNGPTAAQIADATVAELARELED